MGERWRCEACGAQHKTHDVNPRDEFRIAGKRYCCISTFALSACARELERSDTVSNQASELPEPYFKETAMGAKLEEFICERCQEDCDDTSYRPLCPDCYNDMLASGEIEEE